MGLIKSDNTPSSIAPFSMADIERHAKNILLRAQHRAEQLLAAAQGEAENLKKQAHAEGLAEGHRLGLAQGTEQGKQAGQQLALNETRVQFQNAMKSLTAAMTSLDAHRAELETAALVEVVQLAIGIARRVTKRQGLLDPDMLAENLKDAMKLVVRAVDVRIAIHPAQRATLDGVLPQLRIQWPSLVHVKVIEDASIEPGGCRVFTENGQIDADLNGQLDRIAAELLPVADDVTAM